MAALKHIVYAQGAGGTTAAAAAVSDPPPIRFRGEGGMEQLHDDNASGQLPGAAQAQAVQNGAQQASRAEAVGSAKRRAAGAQAVDGVGVVARGHTTSLGIPKAASDCIGATTTSWVRGGGSICGADGIGVDLVWRWPQQPEGGQLGQDAPGSQVEAEVGGSVERVLLLHCDCKCAGCCSARTVAVGSVRIPDSHWFGEKSRSRS